MSIRHIFIDYFIFVFIDQICKDRVEHRSNNYSSLRFKICLCPLFGNCCNVLCLTSSPLSWERFPVQQCLVTSLVDGTADLQTEEEVAWSLEVLGWM